MGDIKDGLRQLEDDLGVEDDELVWFRGCADRSYSLLPSLMRLTNGLDDGEHDQIEQDLFYEFQARAHELRLKGLSDWEYLFYGRHYGLPTRVLDWSDTLGIALYFATEGWSEKSGKMPTIWVLNPFALNDRSLQERDIFLPRRLGVDDDDNYVDFGDLLLEGEEWWWRSAAAIYPIQLNERVRAQRGWFTIHGQDRRPIEEQHSKVVGRLDLDSAAIRDVLEWQDTFGISRFSIYPDLENLATWLRDKHATWIASRPPPVPARRRR